jgi:hypothetical protein
MSFYPGGGGHKLKQNIERGAQGVKVWEPLTYMERLLRIFSLYLLHILLMTRLINHTDRPTAQYTDMRSLVVIPNQLSRLSNIRSI